MRLIISSLLKLGDHYVVTDSLSSVEGLSHNHGRSARLTDDDYHVL
jgi:hypothetical protein